MCASRAAKMWVATVDENGQARDGHWVDIPKPDSFSSDGFAHVEDYVSRLLQSSAYFTSVIIATPDGQIAVTLWRRGGVLEFSLLIDSLPEPERDVRQFFSERRLSISHDHLTENRNIPGAIRCLRYFLPSDGKFIAALIKDALQQIYHVSEQDALDFSFEEDNDVVQ